MNIALYLRISKNDGTQSVQRQLDDLRNFAKEQDWIIVEEITEEISGRRLRRGGTQKIINLARSRKIRKVIVHEISRLGRNTYDVLRTVEALIEAGVSIYDYQQRQETLDDQGCKTVWATMVLPVLAGSAEYWCKLHSDRIKSGLRKAVKQGRRLGRASAKKRKNEDQILAYLHEGKSLSQTAVLANVSRSTVIRIKNKKFRPIN